MGNTAVYLRGPMRQGRLLKTPETRRWPAERIKEFEELESRRICLNFKEEDEGRTRIIIAQTIGPDGAEYARRLIACWNACHGINTDALENGVIKEAKTFIRRISNFTPAGKDPSDDEDTINSLRRLAGPLIARLESK